MSKRSTVLQLLNVIDELAEAIDSGNKINCVNFERV